MNVLKHIFALLVCTTFLVANTKKEKISLQLQWKHQFEFAGYYMAKHKGFYDEVGLDVTFKEFSHGIDITNDVQNGISTYGTNYPSVILDKVNGAKVVILSAILQSSPHAIATLKSSNINSIQDFKGKKVMLNDNAVSSASLFTMFKSKNVSFDDMQIVPHSFNIDDLINKKVDATTVFTSNELFHLEKKGIKYKLWDPKNYGFDFYDNILFTSQKELQDHPKRVQAFKDASLKGWSYALSNIDESIKIILQHYNTQNKSKEALEYEANTLKKLTYFNTKEIGKIEESKIQRIYDIYNILGATKNFLNMENFIYKDKEKSSFQNTLSFKEQLYLKSKQVIKMCNNPHWEPIEFAVDKEMSNMAGISIDTMRELEKRLNVKFENVPTKSWSESQQFLKEKKCDILPSAIKTKQRSAYANFTKPYLNLPLAIFTRKDKPVVSGLDEIMDKTWTRQNGSGLISKINELYPNSKLVSSSSDVEAMELVNSGKVHFTIATLPAASHIISKYLLNDIHIAGYTDLIYKLSIAVRKDDTTLLNILDQALLDIPQSTHKQIFKKWVNPTIKEPIRDYDLLIKFFAFVFVVGAFLFYRQYMLKKSNLKLLEVVEEKTRELNELNKNLEEKIKIAISENSQKDKLLFQQSKMASMGEMIGNIAHQWRQPLSIISTVASGIQIQLEYDMLDKKQTIADLKSMEQSIQYLSATIDDFKNFLKPDTKKETFTIKEVIEKNIFMFGKSFTMSDIELVVNMENIKINGNQNELQQVIINILNNAKDILKESNLEKKYLFIDVYQKNSQAIIDIKDNAGGIDDAIVDKIFEPYFTTKHKSQGTGLGLYMSYQIITNKFDGELKVSNESYTYNDTKCKGAMFRIQIETA